jgi:hypothetical protein
MILMDEDKDIEDIVDEDAEVEPKMTNRKKIKSWWNYTVGNLKQTLHKIASAEATLLSFITPFTDYSISVKAGVLAYSTTQAAYSIRKSFNQRKQARSHDDFDSYSVRHTKIGDSGYQERIIYLSPNLAEEMFGDKFDSEKTDDFSDMVLVEGRRRWRKKGKHTYRVFRPMVAKVKKGLQDNEVQSYTDLDNRLSISTGNPEFYALSPARKTFKKESDIDFVPGNKGMGEIPFGLLVKYNEKVKRDKDGKLVEYEKKNRKLGLLSRFFPQKREAMQDLNLEDEVLAVISHRPKGYNYDRQYVTALKVVPGEEGKVVIPKPEGKVTGVSVDLCSLLTEKERKKRRLVRDGVIQLGLESPKDMRDLSDNMSLAQVEHYSNTFRKDAISSSQSKARLRLIKGKAEQRKEIEDLEKEIENLEERLRNKDQDFKNAREKFDSVVEKLTSEKEDLMKQDD